MKADLASASHKQEPGGLDLESRTLWQSVLDVLDEGVMLHAVDGRVLAVNRQAQALVERSAEEMIGRTCEELFKTGLMSEMALDGAEKAVGVYRLTNGEGAVVGYVRVMPAQTNDRRDQPGDLSAEHLATLGQMIGGLAHDLGTPLNIISGYAEYLLMKMGREGAGHKELTAIIHQARRVAEFVKQIVDLARPVPGGVEAIEVQGFLDSLMDLLGSHLRKIGVGIVLSSRANLPVLYGDGARLKQALFSLVLNCAHAVGSGGELEIVVAEKAAATDELPIILKGKNRVGEAADFSALCADFGQSASDKGPRESGLLLAREILNVFGARVTALPFDAQGVALVITLRRQSGRWSVSA